MPLVYAWQSHGDVDGNDAGAIIRATGNIESIGKVDTELSMAYTWHFYPHNKNALLYGREQPRAPTTLTDTKSYTPHQKDTEFPITYTLKITDGEGDLLVLNIVHGVVHEGRPVYWDPEHIEEGTENEWLIGLEVNAGESTGKFAGKSGTGLIRLVVISNNIPDILGSKKYVAAYDIYLKLGEVLLPPPLSY